MGERGGGKKRKKLYEEMGYTNDNNPFGDSDLGRKFVWKKKSEKAAPRDDRAVVSEIEKVRQRRVEREAAMAEMERVREEERRVRDQSAFADWEVKEEEFALRQTKVRSLLRLASDRAEPIDELAKGVLLVEQADSRRGPSVREGEVRLRATPVRDPRDVLRGLDQAAAADALRGARAFADLERRSRGDWLEYWTSVATICERHLEDGRSSLHGAVAGDLARAFEGKSRAELERTARDVEARRAADGNNYWDRVATECAYALADVAIDEALATFRSKIALEPDSPEPAEPENASRRQPPAERDASAAAVRMEERERDRGCDEDEELFAGEVPLQAASALRKPRYVNRVKTGFEWNKYNQTHYSPEEPPPKIVQGYKFNLFYPDLPPHSKPPTYITLPCPDDPDFVVIKFVSPGPPYADIAFKIVNQEWEHGQRRGYRSLFERGVLQLHFNFKRWRYRR